MAAPAEPAAGQEGPAVVQEVPAAVQEVPAAVHEGPPAVHDSPAHRAADVEPASEVDRGASPHTAPAPASPPRLPAWFEARLDRIMERAIEDGASPGVGLAVGLRRHLLLSRGWGRVDWDPASAAVTDSTLFDLASLTKVVATTTTAMFLVEEGRLDLDRPLHAYLAGWPSTGARGRVTPRHLLAHTSGLPAARALWRSTAGRDGYLDAIAALPLGGEPGAREEYSDLGMILLGLAVEAVADEPLDALAAARVFEPLGMRDTRYRPLDARVAADRIAPTEVDRSYRGMHLRGLVHDPNAHAMGGVAGHAGVFSSVRDLAAFASSVLWERPRPLACRTLVEAFRTRSGARSRFALGWETASEGTLWGDYLSPSAFGHSGYTGTSMWIDPQEDLFVVLLTNRVNPTAANRRHVVLRERVHAAVRSLVVDPFDHRPAAQEGTEVGPGGHTVDGAPLPCPGS